MGVKFDAVKDDKIKVMSFFDTDMSELMERINKFFSHKIKISLEGEEDEYMESSFRYVPISITHSTETRPFTRGPMQFLDSTTVYHAVVLYKEVCIDD